MASWVIELVAATGYLGIVLLMLAENLFPPIPSEVIMPLAGYLAAEGRLSLPGIIAAGTLGSVLGALPFYRLGRRIGEERMKDFADRHGRWLTLSSDDITRAKDWFDRHGQSAVLLGRLIPGIRSLISIPAGIDRMSLGRFLAYTAGGTLLWSGALAWAGYLLGSRFSDVARYLDPMSWVVLGAIVALYLLRVAKHRPRKSADRRFP